MSAPAISVERYRDLLAPVVGASDLVDLSGATVVDLSADPNSPFTLSFLLLALGADRAFAVSDAPPADRAQSLHDLAAAVGWLQTAPHLLLDGRPPSPRTLADRLQGFDLALLAAGDERGLDTSRLMHRVEVPGAWTLPAEHADLALTFSLLEHVAVPDALASLARISRPGGVGIHLLDLVDHRFYAGRVASPFAFLTDDTSHGLVHGGNRLRVHQWIAMFERHGFHVERVEQWASHAPPSAADRAQFAEPFRSMSPEELAPTGARLFVRRAGAAVRRAARTSRSAGIPAGPADAESRDVVPGTAPDRAAAVYAVQAAAALGARAADYVGLEDATTLHGDPLVRLVAFYLPQFHPIPENDAWWGRGFTEWTNVSRAVPQFVGHDQPRLPGELGFYDLRVPDVQRRQVALARRFGIAAFCFYYYWFGGRRLLERPLEQFMADPAIDFPFCVCWANEPWTRRWDGHEDQVLLAQEHDPERDAALIGDLAPALRHRNYVRIDGRPVVLVYRPGLMADPAATAAGWRAAASRTDLPDPFLIAAEAFETLDPRAIGFDAAAEFPPNTAGRPLPPTVTHTRALVDDRYAGRVYRYADMWRWRQHRADPDYALFRGVCPGFDNEARRPSAGSTYVDASPAAYRRWLTAASRTALAAPSRDRRLVFVNAWNEWAEGAYLEPDRRHGYASLDATADALNALRTDWTLLIVSHDACRGGAQRVLLQQIAWLRRHTAIRCAVVCLAGGEWLPRFQALAETALWADLEARAAAAGEDDVTEQLLDLCGSQPALVLANSVASGRALRAIEGLGVPIVTQVHELGSSIARYASDTIGDVVAASAHVIACAEPVRQHLIAAHGAAADAATTITASIEAEAGAAAALDRAARGALRQSLALPQSAQLVVGSGLGMPFRKGADRFIEVARQVAARGRSAVQFVWVGEFPAEEQDPAHGRWADHLARAAEDVVPVTFTGVQEDVAPYLQAADVFLLPSREDPFPLVVLEAAACSVPAICFDGAGGMPAVVGDDAGVVVPADDVAAMADAVVALLDDEPRRQRLGETARAKVLAQYTTDATAPHVLSVCRRVAGRAPTVSVIVPNYNHARYLPERLDSIFGQTFRDVEVIVLDDASTDGSLDVISRYRDRADVRVLANAANSGSTFAQWLKGLDGARGEFVWIAESDDGCAPDLVETLLGLLRDPSVKVAYANSHVWNERSDVVGDYTRTDYLRALSPTKWEATYCVAAEQEVNDGFGVKNTLLSASAVLFRRFALSPETRAALAGLRVAGDWRFFAEAMRHGEVAYTPRTLSFHRRHDESVVGTLVREARVEGFFREFAAAQRWIVDHYRLDGGFEAKWEQYLRHQWAAFCPGRPFEEIAAVYPLADMRARIRASATA